MMHEDEAQSPAQPAPATRQQRRSGGRQTAKRATTATEDEGSPELVQLQRLFVALRDDLDHSGIIDVLIAREDAPSVVLTLDKRFVTPPTLELLHTSGFTVVGKVTQVWSETDDVVNLYRRSVLSLVPSLTQATVWGVFTLLATVARSLDVASIERAAREAAGARPEQDEGPAETTVPETTGAVIITDAETDDEPEDTGGTGEVLLGDDIEALSPVVNGPAFQILPLAICS